MLVSDGELEAALRRVLREELKHQSPTVPIAKSFRQEELAAAVRAELARAGKTSLDLVGALGVTRQTVNGRLSGAYVFSMEELGKVADVLGISAYNIVESAMLGRRFAEIATPPEEVERVFARDAWAQPPRAVAADRRRAEGRRPGPN